MKKRLTEAIRFRITPTSGYVERKMNGHWLVMDVSDKWIRDNFLWCGVYEPDTTRYIEENVRKGDLVLDIGAHIGYHSLNFARAGACVEAFEPDPDLFRLLKRNVADYEVECHQSAVSDIDGEVTLYMNEDRRAWNSLLPRRDAIPVKVLSLTIDWYLYYEPVDWIKIDVEGLELQVLKGAENTLEVSPDVKLIVEWLPKNDGDLRGIAELLKGWKCKRLDHNMLFWREEE